MIWAVVFFHELSFFLKSNSMLAQNCLFYVFILNQIAHHTYIKWLWVLHLLLSPFSPLRVRLVWSVTESGIVHNKVCRVVWIYPRKAKIRNWKLRFSEKAIWLYVCCLYGKLCMYNQVEAGLNAARTYLQPHYGNGVFGNVYLSAGQH